MRYGSADNRSSHKRNKTNDCSPNDDSDPLKFSPTFSEPQQGQSHHHHQQSQTTSILHRRRLRNSLILNLQNENSVGPGVLLNGLNSSLRLPSSSCSLQNSGGSSLRFSNNRASFFSASSIGMSTTAETPLSAYAKTKKEFPITLPLGQITSTMVGQTGNSSALPPLPSRTPITNDFDTYRRRSSVFTRRGTTSLHFYNGSQFELGERTGSKLTLDEELYDILYAFGYLRK